MGCEGVELLLVRSSCAFPNLSTLRTTQYTYLNFYGACPLFRNPSTSATLKPLIYNSDIHSIGVLRMRTLYTTTCITCRLVKAFLHFIFNTPTSQVLFFSLSLLLIFHPTIPSVFILQISHLRMPTRVSLVCNGYTTFLG